MKRLIALLVVVALLMAAGAVAALVLGTDESAPAAPDPTPDPPESSQSASPTPAPGTESPPSAQLAEFYSQDLRWQSCRDELECATLEVPLDYDEPGRRVIDLALLKVPAAAPEDRVGALVVNPGGPGQPGTEYAAQAGLVFGQPLLDRFDIIGFDPRGTGESTPVDCVSDAGLDELIAADPDPDTAAERRALVRRTRDLVGGCARRSGDLAAHVSTVEAARDVDVLRAALGESKLNYLGASYGTELGATYAELFPERVGRLVLDGAVDLTLSSRDLTLEQARGFETALRAYVRDCVDTGDPCVLGDRVGEALARISDLLDEVDRRPLPTSSNRELRVGNAFYGIVLPLYVRDYWFLLTTALGSAFNGDGSALLQLSDLYNSRGPQGYTDNSREAFVAISCLDDPSSIPPRRVPAAFPEFEKASPTFGRVFAWGLIGCRGAPVTSEEPVEVDGSGAPPIVVIGTTRDPATPYAWARSLADQLESGVLVTRKGDGHTGYLKGNDCVDQAVHDYLLAGEVPDDGLSC